MNIEFERTIDDVIDFNLFHIAHSPSIKKQMLVVQVLTGVLVVPLVSILLYFVYDFTTPIALVVGILAGILASALYLPLSQRGTIDRIQKMLNEGDNKALLGHQVMSFSPEGIICKSQSAESKINWSAIDKAIQSEKHFFLYTSSINALVIPKNCFQSEKEQKDFLKYINKHLQQK